MSDFYSQNDYRNYLQHHGIKGMRWGEQNGPPYPLSTKVHNMVVRGREKRAAKKKEKILHDPKKLYKHRKEFSKEEIDQALAKMESSERVKGKIKLTRGQMRRQQKRLEKEKTAADKKFTKKMEKYAANAKMLEQNVDKFTPDELRVALNRVQTKQNVFDAKINELNRPKKFLDLGLGYVDTAINAVTKFKSIKRLFESKYDEHGQTEQDRMNTKTMKKIFDLSNSGKTEEAYAFLMSNSTLTNNFSKLNVGKKGKNNSGGKSDKDDQLRNLGESLKTTKQENENLKIQLASMNNVQNINADTIKVLNEYIASNESSNDSSDWERLIHSDLMDINFRDLESIFDNTENLDNILYSRKGGAK